MIPHPYIVSIQLIDHVEQSSIRHRHYYITEQYTLADVEQEVRARYILKPWQEVYIHVTDVYLPVEYSRPLEGAMYHEAPF